MSTIKLENIQTRTGSGTITIGASGETVDLGATAGGTFTSRPAFSAYQTSDQSISHATDTKLNFDAESYDTDSAFDLTNNRFTVPTGKAGKYLFKAQTLLRSDSGNFIIVRFAKNGTQQYGTAIRMQTSIESNAGGSFSVATLDLSASDYVEAFVYQNNGNTKDTYYDYTVFEGHRLIGV